MMKTVNDIYESEAMKEVLQWKEEASEQTKDMDFEHLKAHYDETMRDLEKLTGLHLLKEDSGAYKLVEVEKK